MSASSTSVHQPEMQRSSGDPHSDIELGDLTGPLPTFTATDRLTSPTVLRPSPEKQKRVQITPWRVLNTIVILGFGIAKALLTYQGHSTAPTTLDWLGGVLWVSISYWVSILEIERPDTWWFEHNDLIIILVIDSIAIVFVMVVTVIVTVIFAAYCLFGAFLAALLTVHWHMNSGMLTKFFIDALTILIIVSGLVGMAVGPIVVHRIWIGSASAWFLVLSARPQWRLSGLFSSSDWHISVVTVERLTKPRYVILVAFCAYAVSWVDGFAGNRSRLFHDYDFESRGSISWNCPVDLTRRICLKAIFEGLPVCGGMYIGMGFVRMVLRLRGIYPKPTPTPNMDMAPAPYAITIPLPAEWEERFTPLGGPYFFNISTGFMTSTDPRRGAHHPATISKEPTPSATSAPEPTTPPKGKEKDSETPGTSGSTPSDSAHKETAPSAWTFKGKSKEDAAVAPDLHITWENSFSEAMYDDLRAEIATISAAFKAKQAQVTALEQSLLELTQHMRAFTDTVLNDRTDLARAFALVPLNPEAPAHMPQPTESSSKNRSSAPSSPTQKPAQIPDHDALHTSSVSVASKSNNPSHAPNPAPEEPTSSS